MASDPAAALVQSLVHPALAPGDGAPLEEARWTDRQRLGAVLQGAALLAHLEQTGWHAPAGFAEARGAADGGLLAPGCRPGRSREPAPEALKALLARLFGAGEIAGRGEARRAARALLDRWRADLAPAPPDEAVGQVLATAPFLWEDDFAGARRALAAEHHRPDGASLWVAGPGRFRARLLARCRDLAALADLLASAEARALWEGEEGAEPSALAAAQRWAAAVAAWGRRPPATGAERLELARALAALGRYERALEALADARPAPARALKAWCQLQLGRLGSALATLRRLEGLDLTAEEVVDAAEVAARALANAGEPERAAAWVERALAAARGPLRPRAELLAALAAWDREDPPAMDRHLAAARPLAADAELAWRWHHAGALRAMAAGDGAAVVAAVSRALAGPPRPDPHRGRGAVERPRLRPCPGRRPGRRGARLPPRRAPARRLRRAAQDDARAPQPGRDPAAPRPARRRARDPRAVGGREPAGRQPARPGPRPRALGAPGAGRGEAGRGARPLPRRRGGPRPARRRLAARRAGGARRARPGLARPARGGRGRAGARRRRGHGGVRARGAAGPVGARRPP